MKKLIFILTALLLFSCGSRKVEKSNTKKETKANEKEIVKNDLSINDNTKTTTVVKVNDSTKEEIEEIVIEADDKTKPAFHEGKELNNSKITKRKIKRNKALNSQTNTNTSNDIKTRDKGAKQSEKAQQTKKDEQIKNVNRKQFDILAFLISYWWIWLLIIIVLYLIKRFKLFGF